MLKRGRGYCDRYPSKGKKRCTTHNSVSEGRLPPCATGAHYSDLYQRLEKKHRQELDQMLADPNLLDVRRGVALAQLAMSRVQILPNDSMLERMALRHKISALPPVDLPDAVVKAMTKVDDTDLAIERQKYLDGSLSRIERFHRRQTEAMRMVEAGRILRAQVLPVLEEMSLQIGRLIDQFVPEAHKETFRARFRARCMQLLADLSAIADG